MDTDSVLFQIEEVLEVTEYTGDYDDEMGTTDCDTTFSAVPVAGGSGYSTLRSFNSSNILLHDPGNSRFTTMTRKSRMCPTPSLGSGLDCVLAAGGDVTRRRNSCAVVAFPECGLDLLGEDFCLTVSTLKYALKSVPRQYLHRNLA